ncbi:MAG: NADH-quinone oxidoreductase subunit J family protein [Myxococcota bacterium]
MPLFKLLFYIISLGIIGLAFITAISKNIVRSVFALLGVMIGVACLYGILGSSYLAVIQIMIYVGGIMVLFIFAVMFTSKIEDVNVTNRSLGKIQAVIISLAIFIVLAFIILTYPFEKGAVSEHQSIERIGKVISTDYLPFLIGIAVILLVSLIGAITIARPKKESE